MKLEAPGKKQSGQLMVIKGRKPWDLDNTKNKGNTKPVSSMYKRYQ